MLERKLEGWGGARVLVLRIDDIYMCGKERDSSLQQ